jgi:hypothetical protein
LEVGEIGAGDQQHEPYGACQDRQRQTALADDAVGQEGQIGLDALVGFWMDAGERLERCAEIRCCRRLRHTGSQPEHGSQEMDPSVLCPRWITDPQRHEEVDVLLGKDEFR